MSKRNDMYIREDFEGNDYKNYIDPKHNIRILRFCFAGHSHLDGSYEEVRERLEKVFDELFKKYNFLECYVGNYGEFDRMSTDVACRYTKKTERTIALNLVIPYLTSDITAEKNTYYDRFDDIVVPYIPPSTPKNLGIIKANQYMVDKCDCLICYVKYSFGGAAKTLEYAKKKGLEIINLAENT